MTNPSLPQTDATKIVHHIADRVKHPSLQAIEDEIFIKENQLVTTKKEIKYLREKREILIKKLGEI